MNILVTGAAGFIGFHLSIALLKRGNKIVGFDNINDYYTPKLKEDRLAILKKDENFTFIKGDLADKQAVFKAFEETNFDRVINLGAQAGVRYSLQNPDVYISSNIVGFLNILEVCRKHKTAHLVFASSSSVYGMNTSMPFSVHDNVDHPVSLYAATKKSNELMAHTYAHLFGIPVTGLRFFTVYGPWGRPDMAPFLFTSAILEGKPIKVFNNGQMKRDFTFVDDIVEGVVRVMDLIPQANSDYDTSKSDPSTSKAPYKIYNIGNNKPVELLKFIETIEEKTGKKAEKIFMPMQAGDVVATYADVSDLMKDTGFSPSTPLDVGIGKFVDWYRDYYKI